LETKRVIALGFFDGVHLGHGGLLQKARQVAHERGCTATVLTFDQHPDNLVMAHPTPLINTRDDRAWLCKSQYGMDECIFAHFDRAMQSMSWQAFVTDYLVKGLGAVHLVCGHDFRFGYRGEGTPELLKAACRDLGLGCDVIPQICLDGVTVSSTHIRSLLAAGDVETANRFLGHPHCLSGEVVHGKQLGRTLGIPTANLLIPDGLLAPAFGVYATKVIVGSEVYAAVTNVGVRPTVEDTDKPTVEPWLLDFDGDLYGQNIRVEFYKFLRGEQRFDGVKSLQEAIWKNAAETRAYFH
jgi:riboflavin kinase/FMN adenylyltransferase